MEAAASMPCLSCSPGFSWVPAFAPTLDYAASDNHYFYIMIRRSGLIGIRNPDRHSLWPTSKRHIPRPCWNPPRHEPSPNTRSV